MTVSVYKTQEDFGQFIRLHFAKREETLKAALERLADINRMCRH